MAEPTETPTKNHGTTGSEQSVISPGSGSKHAPIINVAATVGEIERTSFPVAMHRHPTNQQQSKNQAIHHFVPDKLISPREPLRSPRDPPGGSLRSPRDAERPSIANVNAMTPPGGVAGTLCPGRSGPAPRPSVFSMSTPRESLGTNDELDRSMDHSAQISFTSSFESVSPIRLSNTHLTQVPEGAVPVSPNTRRLSSIRREKITKGFAIGTFVLVLVGIIAILLVLLTERHAAPEPVPGPVPIHPLPRTGDPPLGRCTPLQIVSGCAAGFCHPEKCWCDPTSMQVGTQSCAKPQMTTAMDFYVYRVIDSSDKHSYASTDDLSGEAASLEGISWALNRYNVSDDTRRILRLRAKVYNTDAPWIIWQGQFGPWMDLSGGSCKTTWGATCDVAVQKFGHSVGCIKWAPYMGFSSYGNRTQWYSFPGAIAKKGKGGRCSNPDGSWDCTWNLAPAGDIRVSDVKAEQDIETVGAIRKLFSSKFPKSELPEPICNNWNAQCRYHEGCTGMSGNCCPFDNGVPLPCCTAQKAKEVIA